MPTSPSHRRTALLVAGMHRSGTSAFGGVLAALGAQAPKSLMAPTKDNPRGYWESTALMQFHDRVLASAGSSWYDWSRFNPDWLDSSAAGEHLDALPALIADEFGDSPMLLVKDPRICRVLPLWRRVLRSLDIAPKVILPIRHPLEVVRSLEARDSFVSSRSTLIWLRHVLDAEHDSRGLDRVLIRYTDVLADWRTQMRKVSDALHLPWPKWSVDTEVAIDQYLSAGLRHHDEGEAVSQPRLAAWAEGTFAAMAQLADDPEDTGALATLDAIRADFDRSSELFAAVARETELRAARERRQRERDAAESAKKVAAIEEQLRERDAAHATDLATAKQGQAAELEDLQSRLAASEQALANARRDQEAARQSHEAALSDLREQRAERDQRIESLLADAGVHEKRVEALLVGQGAQAQRLEEVAAELAVARESTAGKDLEIAERFGEIAALTRLLAQKEHGVEQAEVERRTLNGVIEKHRTRVAVLEKQLADMRKRTTTTQQALAAAQARLAAEESALQQRTEELARLQASLSWRATAPLRRVSRLGRRPTRDNGRDADVELVRATDLFDAAWYLASNPDVASAGIDPAEHYVLHGGYEGRDPGPRFASRRYLETYPDVADVGMNPLVHYLRHGQAEGRTIPATTR